MPGRSDNGLEIPGFPVSPPSSGPSSAAREGRDWIDSLIDPAAGRNGRTLWLRWLDAKRLEGFGHLTALRLDQVQQFFRGARVLGALRVRVHRLQVEVLRLDLLACPGPAPVAVGALRQEAEELLELVEREWALLSHLDAGEIVVPDPLRWPAPGEKEEVGLHARARVDERPRREAQDTPEITVVQQFALGLDKGRF